MRNGCNYSYYHRENEAEQGLKSENMIKDQFKMHSCLAVNSTKYTSEHFNHIFGWAHFIFFKSPIYC